MLTEENLDQLDELYKMISPTRDSETDYLESLSEASEHIVCLLDAKDKPVVGTTSYKVKSHCYCCNFIIICSTKIKRLLADWFEDMIIHACWWKRSDYESVDKIIIFILPWTILFLSSELRLYSKCCVFLLTSQYKIRICNISG